MDEKTLNIVVRSLQMICLLEPIAKVNKPVRKNISRLQSTIQANAAYLVIQAKTQNQQAVPGAIDAKLEVEKKIAFLNLAHSTLLSYLTSMADIGELIHRAYGGKSSYRAMRTSALFSLDASSNFVEKQKFLGALGTVAFAELTKGNVGFYTSHLMKPMDYSEKMGEILHTLRSVSRNTSWMPLLLDLKLDGPTATKYALALKGKFSSRMGGSLLAERYESLITMVAKDKAATAKAKRARSDTPMELGDDSIEVTVSLKAKAVMEHPAVVSRLQELGAYLGSSETLSPENGLSVFTEVFAPAVVESGKTPKECATAVFNKFLNSLDEMLKAKAKEQAKLKVKRETEEKQKALAALRKMGPLLDVLKNNPGLLTEA